MSGGFEPKPKIYELLWDDGTAYPGLEVTAKGMSTSGFFELGEMADAMGDPPKAAESRKLLQRFARQLIAWNITSGGQPVPADYEHLADLDFDLAMEIFMRWSKAVGGVDPTSPAKSNGGGTSREALPPGLAEASASLAP
jgi:hypothetical protein